MCKYYHMMETKKMKMICLSFIFQNRKRSVMESLLKGKEKGTSPYVSVRSVWESPF